jgi:chaperonin GroEL
MTFERGYVHPDFLVGSNTDSISLTNCVVALCDGRAARADDVIPVLQHARAASAPVLIVADEIDDHALETLILNHRQQNVHCVAVRAPGYADRRALILRDVAAFVGARVVERGLGRSLADITPADLGRSELVRVTADQTTLIGGGGRPEDVERRAAEVRAEIENALDDLTREKAQERLGRLRGRIVTVHIGGTSVPLRAERRELAINAMFAVKAALESGAVVGGGVSLIKARGSITALAEVSAARRAGVRGVLRALEEPLRLLARSAGQDEAQSVVMAESGVADNLGINVRTRCLEDLVSAGVIDPVAVVRSACEIALDTARIVLMTESWESAKPFDS